MSAIEAAAAKAKRSGFDVGEFLDAVRADGGTVREARLTPDGETRHCARCGRARDVLYVVTGGDTCGRCLEAPAVAICGRAA